MGTRYVLGLGGTVDYEIGWDPELLGSLAARWGIRPDELDPGRSIDSERDLLCSLLGFLRSGSGGERFVASSRILADFAARFDRRITLGGTCVRAAMVLERFGLPALVHLVSIDDDVRRLLPAGTEYLCSADRDSTDPHLIVQFPSGATVPVGGIEVVAARANRLIYVNDPPNRELVLDPALGDELAAADVVLLSGFNVIQDPAVLADRLGTLTADLDRLPPAGFVYFEDAGYHVPALTAAVRDALAPRVDVWAMNEDEWQAWIGRPVDLLDAEDVAGALLALRAVVPARTLVLHTQHWALAEGERAAELRAALRGGIVAAGTRYAHGDDFTAEQYRAIADREPGPLGSGLAERLAGVAPAVVVEPAHQLDVPRPTTIGLGDTFVGGFLSALARR